MEIRRNKRGFKAIAAILTGIFLFSSFGLPGYAQAVSYLPAPREMVQPSVNFSPVALRGLKLYPQDPFKLEFILDEGDAKLSDAQVREESQRLIKYFLTALTIPAQDIWVNLSPYEGERIIPEAVGLTDIGRDLLAQDYILKQLAASLTYPESALGKQYWNDVLAKTQARYGTTKVPINTYNKVWIVPAGAEVFESGTQVVIAQAALKVMADEDYLAMQKNRKPGNAALQGASGARDEAIASNAFKVQILPLIEKEVNTGKNFAYLRQIHNAIVLATWFKVRLRQSVYKKLYIDKAKILGIENEDPQIKEKVFQQYVEAFKAGVYNYIRRDYDPRTGRKSGRSYYSGGAAFGDYATNGSALPAGIKATVTTDPAVLERELPYNVDSVVARVGPYFPAVTPKIPTTPPNFSGKPQVTPPAVVSRATRSLSPRWSQTGLVATVAGALLLLFTANRAANEVKEVSRAPDKTTLSTPAPMVAHQRAIAVEEPPVEIAQMGEQEIALPDGTKETIATVTVTPMIAEKVDGNFFKNLEGTVDDKTLSYTAKAKAVREAVEAFQKEHARQIKAFRNFQAKLAQDMANHGIGEVGLAYSLADLTDKRKAVNVEYNAVLGFITPLLDAAAVENYRERAREIVQEWVMLKFGEDAVCFTPGFGAQPFSFLTSENKPDMSSFYRVMLGGQGVMLLGPSWAVLQTTRAIGLINNDRLPFPEAASSTVGGRLEIEDAIVASRLSDKQKTEALGRLKYLLDDSPEAKVEFSLNYEDAGFHLRIFNEGDIPDDQQALLDAFADNDPDINVLADEKVPGVTLGDKIKMRQLNEQTFGVDLGSDLSDEMTVEHDTKVIEHNGQKIKIDVGSGIILRAPKTGEKQAVPPAAGQGGDNPGPQGLNDDQEGGVSEKSLTVKINSDGTAVPLLDNVELNDHDLLGFTFNISNLNRGLTPHAIINSSAVRG